MAVSISKTATHIYKVVGGLSLTIDVSVPGSFNRETGVVLLHFHGGFLVSDLLYSQIGFFEVFFCRRRERKANISAHKVIGEKTTFPPNWLINTCHRRRWAYATASYRLLPESSGLQIISDALDATRWASQNVAKNIILAGSSAGGYLAVATAADPQAPPLLAVLSIYGMLDLTSKRYIELGTNLGGHPPVDCRDAITAIEEAGTSGQAIDGYPFPIDPSTDKRFSWIRAIHQNALYPDLKSRTPGLSTQISSGGMEVISRDQKPLFPSTFNVTASFPPMALIHGDEDVLVPVDQSALLAEKLSAVGVKVLFERVAGQGHGFDVRGVPLDIDVEVSNVQDREFYESLRRVVAFLDGSMAVPS